MTTPAVRVAIVDSGVNFAHPHVGGPAQGVSLVRGEREQDLEDRAGHGTCVAALVRWIAPRADLDAIKVLPPDMRVSSAMLAEALEVAAARGARIINVSIGTRDETHRDRLAEACARAAAAGAVVVAAALPGHERLLPAALPGVVAVAPQQPPALLRHDPGSWPSWFAGPEARPAEGPPRPNFRGPSMSAARVSGVLARLLEEGEPDPVSALAELARAERTVDWLR